MPLGGKRAALDALHRAWPVIVREARAVLGGELHYQAMIYHALRSAGAVPVDQVGMNVKQWIDKPRTPHFRALDKRKNENYQGGFEPIPDIVIFDAKIKADWRRRNADRTLRHMLLAIEVKASERCDGRLRPGEIIRDIDKIAAHRDEAARIRKKGRGFAPVVMIIDTAREEAEQMTQWAFERTREHAAVQNVAFYYLCQDEVVVDVPPSI